MEGLRIIRIHGEGSLVKYGSAIKPALPVMLQSLTQVNGHGLPISVGAVETYRLQCAILTKILGFCPAVAW